MLWARTLVADRYGLPSASNGTVKDMRRAFAILVLPLLLAMGTDAALAEKRVALIIGNSAYEAISPLRNPKNDADLMESTLRDVGFDVIVAKDADFRGMRRAIRDFGRKLRAAGKDAVGLFYFAGHGVQSQGDNYLVPIGAQIESDADLAIEAIRGADVLRQMEDAGNTLNLVILDSCRNNPFQGRVRSASRGLTRISAASGTLIAFSAAPGQVAVDGTGLNSPYTTALAKHIRTPNLPVEEVFKRVRVEVEDSTSGKQTPWEESSLRGSFYFAGRSVTVTETAPARPEPEAKPNNDAFELSFWDSIRGSKNAEDYEAYLKDYPNGRFVRLAKLRINRIKRRQLQAKVDPKPAPEPAPAIQTPPKKVPPTPRLTQQLTWRISTAFPPNFPHFHASVERFAQSISTFTRGKVQVQIHTAREIVPVESTIDAVTLGLVSAGWAPISYWKEKEVGLSLLTDVPFGFEPEGLHAWRLTPNVEAIADEMTAKLGIHTLPCGAAGRLGDLWSNKPFRTFADLMGAKVRFPGVPGEILTHSGALQFALPGGEIYPSLERSVIDASNGQSPQIDHAFGFQKVAKYYYYPGYVETGRLIDLFFSTGVWNAMPRDVQRMVEYVCADNVKEDLIVARRENDKALKAIRNAGVQVQPLSRSVRRKLLPAWRSVANSLKRQSTYFSRLYDTLNQHRGGALAQQSQ